VLTWPDRRHPLPVRTTSLAPDSSRPRWPWRWVSSVVLALLALARWLQTGDGLALAAAGVGLAAAVWWSRGLSRPRGPAIVTLAALAIALGVATAETRALRVLAAEGEAWALAARNRDIARVAEGIGAALRAARLAAAQAAASGVPTPPAVAGAETGLVLYRGGQPVARAGQARVPLTPGPAGVTLESGVFHHALLVRETREAPDGPRTAVASVLLTAAAPADRFARALVPHLTSPEVAPSLRLDPPAAGESFDVADDTRRLVRAAPDSSPVLVVSAAPRSLEEAVVSGRQRARVRTVVPLALAALGLLVVGWRRPARLRERLLVVLALLAFLALVPLGTLSNVSPLFNAANYFAPGGGPFTANIAALTLAAGLLLLALFRVLRSTRVARQRRPAAALVLGIAALGPFALRDLARGIVVPPNGPGVGLWVAWQLALALAAAGVLAAGASVGQAVLARRRGVPSAIAPLLAAGAALLAPLLWRAPGAWPVWYPALWIAAIGALAFVRRSGALVAAAAFVAGCGAVTLTWGATTRARMQLAERDVPRLGAVDEAAYPLLVRFTETLAQDGRVPDRATLLRRFAATELARAGYPARLAIWRPERLDTPVASIALATIGDDANVQGQLAAMVRDERAPQVFAADDGPFTMLVAAVPFADAAVVTVAVPPRTSLLGPDPFAPLTGLALAPERAPPYRLALGIPVAAIAESASGVTWRREGAVMIGDADIGAGSARRRARVEVELRGLEALGPRGALLVLLDVGIVLLVWGASAMADGGLARWLRWQRRRWRRSYRGRLSLALLTFFLAPAVAFTAWEAYRLRQDDLVARDLLVRDALARLDQPLGARPSEPTGLLTTASLAGLAQDVGGPLFVYRGGVLTQASDPVLADLAPLGTLLPVDVPVGAASGRVRLDGAEADVATRSLALGARTARVGYRPTLGPEGMPLVLATAARGDEFALEARRVDLAVLVLLLAICGALGALWLSGVAARELARPIGALRNAALHLAAGRPMPPLEAMPPAEFVPVFGAFAQMATDLAASRAALEEAQRRTAAVLREVASGVVALRNDGRVLLANPRAAELLRAPLPPGRDVLSAGEGALPRVAPRLREFLASPQRALTAFELDGVGGERRQLRASLTRLPGGAVLTLDDVTELASAQRVLAWGEMARQVAHEIKNPLTPIRLGVQHLRRAWRDGRADFGAILDTNVTRILAEIDHLDEIARAFSRYGSAPAERPPPVPVDVAAVARDVVALEQLGEGAVTWRLAAPDGEAPVLAWAQADELREVLLNLLENARLAEARTVRSEVARAGDAVVVRVHDDGVGMAPDVSAQVFQPHFSTRTSGSGLGLAISRRLLEGWGGRIDVTSRPGVGSTFTVTLRAVTGAD
jgi:two-component system nitrogen regulation sensor histidine kinase NtrY